MDNTVTIENLMEKLRENVPSQQFNLSLSPKNVKRLIDDHEEIEADKEAQTKEGQESFQHLRASIEAAQSVVDMLQKRHRVFTGQDHVWLR
jgi:hypothetical protein